MTGALHALPATPFSALAGLPAPTELPDAASRRRFAQTLACALLDQPSYEVEVCPADQLSIVLERRALREDWPLIANADTVVLLRPIPLSTDHETMIEAAAATRSEPVRTALATILRSLWQGDWPAIGEIETGNEPIGEAIRGAARAGHMAAEAALQLAEARALGA